MSYKSVFFKEIFYSQPPHNSYKANLMYLTSSLVLFMFSIVLKF